MFWPVVILSFHVHICSRQLNVNGEKEAQGSDNGDVSLLPTPDSCIENPSLPECTPPEPTPPDENLSIYLSQ
jgi:hypothetical protein